MKRLVLSLALMFIMIMATVNVQGAPGPHGSPPGQAIIVQQDLPGTAGMTCIFQKGCEMSLQKEILKTPLRIEKREIQMPVKQYYTARHECLRAEITKRKYLYMYQKNWRYDQGKNYLGCRSRDKPGSFRYNGLKIPTENG